MPPRISAATAMITYTVSQLNARIRAQLESDYRDIWVEGEISNLSRPASGHLYFTLKDDAAQVACALFKGNSYRLSLPARELANGLAVRVHGRATLYEPRGNYQLVLDQIEAAGIGALEAELKRRRDMLAAEGCFDAARKRPIPPAPRQIGIITSTSGAAIHDALTTLRRRNPLVGVIIYPSLVQGEQAPAQLIRQIETANRRGETDVTLADLAADLRAPTPTAAAAHSCPDLGSSFQHLARLKEQLHGATRRRLQNAQQRQQTLAHRLHQQNPQRQIRTAQQRADQLGERLHAAAHRRWQREQTRLSALMQHLHHLSPLNVLQRGYALAYNAEGKTLARSDAVQPGDKISVRLASGRLHCTVNRRSKN